MNWYAGTDDNPRESVDFNKDSILEMVIWRTGTEGFMCGNQNAIILFK